VRKHCTIWSVDTQNGMPLLLPYLLPLWYRSTTSKNSAAASKYSLGITTEILVIFAAAQETSTCNRSRPPTQTGKDRVAPIGSVILV